MSASLYFIELTVGDLSASRTWYQRILGLEVLVDAEGFVLLQSGAVRLALKAGASAPGSTLLTFEVKDLDAWIARLEQNGIELEEGLKISHEPAASAAGCYRRVRLRDPDGYALCLFAWVES